MAVECIARTARIVPTAGDPAAFGGAHGRSRWRAGHRPVSVSSYATAPFSLPSQSLALTTRCHCSRRRASLTLFAVGLQICDIKLSGKAAWDARHRLW
jgi:hypothetical protein